ncbi:hypothetical protein HELRODRAFT_192841 [Helobdella robusta]|uniref:C2H2-type domain-containing protein n=1 Tax=Helobdella robusta TaxID=6412 RepID=T1FUC7_HELRO|nr:hypothetical protein HELRODRAFT_192841 [Helobdella robusta]ESN99517.1 hypothetical protein HELRODRAFT_192841 [Helobdella robusta]
MSSVATESNSTHEQEPTVEMKLKESHSPKNSDTKENINSEVVRQDSKITENHSTPGEETKINGVNNETKCKNQLKNSEINTENMDTSKTKDLSKAKTFSSHNGFKQVDGEKNEMEIDETLSSKPDISKSDCEVKTENSDTAKTSVDNSSNDRTELDGVKQKIKDEILTPDVKSENVDLKINDNKKEVTSEKEDDSESGDVIIIESDENTKAPNMSSTSPSNSKFKSNQSYDQSFRQQNKTQSITPNKNDINNSPSSSSGPNIGDTSMTAFARLLHDLGVELVRQHVYKDLVEIQLSKDAQNKLNEREKEQLSKLEEFYSKQEIRNAPYSLKQYVTRCKCRVFATESLNVMRLHQEYGRMESGSTHVCCCCREFKSRWPSHYISHMKTDHDMIGRLRKKMSPYRCSFCSYEAKNQLKIDSHMLTCSKRFVLACNLQPLPADTDIPLKRRFIQPSTYAASTQRYSSYLNNNNNYSNYHQQNNYYSQQQQQQQAGGGVYGAAGTIGRGMVSSASSMYSNQVSGTVSGGTVLSQQQQQMVKDGRGVMKMTSAANAGQMETCEICSASVGSRASLLNHLQVMHKVKLNTARGSTEPTMSCDRCPSRFWTYQGLAKHATIVHRINTGMTSSTPGNQGRTPPICHICGESQTINPLNHMSTRHNITLLDMYQVKQCYICNKALKNGPNFQEHMVLYHRDIFANKDVLHTVLQALSAARHLKREESSSVQHHQQQQQNQQSSASTSFSSSSSSSSTNANYNNKYKKLTGNQPQPQQQQQQRHGNMTAPKRRVSQSTSHVVNTIPSKPVEKKTTEQERLEMEKLYENFAGIGRPILRSMKQRLSSSGNSSASNAAAAASAATASPSASANVASSSSPLNTSSTNNNCSTTSDVVATNNVSNCTGNGNSGNAGRGGVVSNVSFQPLTATSSSSSTSGINSTEQNNQLQSSSLTVVNNCSKNFVNNNNNNNISYHNNNNNNNNNMLNDRSTSEPEAKKIKLDNSAGVAITTNSS